MKEFFLKKILGLVGQKLDGKKTLIGGVGGIVLGVLGIVKVMFPDQLPQLPDLGVEASLAAISAGFAVLGIGGKLEKNTQAVKAATPPTTTVSGSPVVSPRDGGNS